MLLSQSQRISYNFASSGLETEKALSQTISNAMVQMVAMSQAVLKLLMINCLSRSGRINFNELGRKDMGFLLRNLAEDR